MSQRGKLSNVTIGAHRLTWAQLTVLNQIQDYMCANAGDSRWGHNVSPKGDGRAVPLREIFPDRNISSNAKRHCARRLSELGILRACCIEMGEDMLKGVPFGEAK
jgi:hypothetical protein